ncbi:hypothetical protein PANT_7d00268 [Moesziomyces antarcticus T-34]|uniref:Translation initiation factor eIF2B subunit beta n=1 Tax=Pseudozyma antarctica (strain T-34) TaxID=1151754 RepID=M9MBP6_PSEA3|nr:hypothetical protein PANT_7d00268 [Moesziomyces antarcticus T-34]
MTASTTLAGAGLPTPKLAHHAPFETIIKEKSSQKLLIALSLQLRRGQITGPEAVSEATAKTLRSVVSSAKYSSMQELIDIIKAAGRHLQLSQPAEQSIGNITRRIVHLLREEAKAALIEAREKELESGRGSGSGSGINSLSNSISDLHLASAFGAPVPGHSAAASGSHSSGPMGQSPGARLNRSLGGSTSHSQFPSSSSSAVVGSHSLTRPGPHPLRGGSESGPASSGSSAFGSGVFDSSFSQLQQHMSTVSLAEDAAGEAEAEEAESRSRRSTLRAGDDETESESDDDDEDDDDEDDDESDEGEAQLITGKKSAGAYFLKPLLIQAIQDLIDELETVDDNIAKVSRDHIHSGEVILTLGASATVQSFFLAAAKDRKFTVIVPETAPSYAGHDLARALSQAGISVLLIPDSSIFGVMPRVSKVVLGAHAVLANGGLMAHSGAFATALAARQHSTPVVITTGVYKICPEWSEIQTFSNAASVGALGPAALMHYATSTSIVENTEIASNALDYVPPYLVDVFITNVGEHPPSYVYRLVKENYHADDIVL